MRALKLLLVGALAASSVGCGPEEPAWVDGEIGVFRAGLTVGQAGGCSTAIVAGLTQQLIDEQNCLKPNALASFKGAGISVGSAVNAFLEPPAAAALKKAVAAHGGAITINSALRSLAQQYLLYQWQGTCGIQIAAQPGSSNHETGIAIDVDNYGVFQSALEAQGFAWYGAGDKVHFDYRGAGAVDLRATSVLAFQRLWNLNNPGDPILTDGAYGPMTEARLAKAPAGGFAKGSTCTPPAPMPGTPPGTTPPAPTTPEWAAALVDREAPDALAPGAQATVVFRFRNTGTETWTPDRTRLGTSAPRDRQSVLATSGWLSPSRPAHVEAETPPGAIGRFTFDIQAPVLETAGAYDEDFSLVEEAVTWFGPEMGVSLSLEVNPDLQPTGQTTPAAGASGCSATGHPTPAPLALLLLLLPLAHLTRRRASRR